MVDGVSSSAAFTRRTPTPGESPRFPPNQPGAEESPQSNLRAGFGHGTVTTPGAALQTLDRGVRAAAETAPSLEDLQAAQRAARSEERKFFQEERLERPFVERDTSQAPSAADETSGNAGEGQPPAASSSTFRSSSPDRPGPPPAAAPEPHLEPPIANLAPTGPNALSGQRLNLLA